MGKIIVLMKKHIPIVLLHVLFQLYAGASETVSVFSAAMNKNIPALVVLPDSYKNESVEFSIIILLLIIFFVSRIHLLVDSKFKKFGFRTIIDHINQ